jgi:hypothetical protein
MATSETLLTVIAIRLAAVLVAGIVAKAVAADHPNAERGYGPTAVAAEVQMQPAAREADEVLRDMLLHD